MIFAAVLCAAVLHASWNAIAKVIPNSQVAAGSMSLVSLAAGAVGAALLPLPQPSAWPFLLTSATLHAGYLVLLVRAYRYGQFGQIYPLARGLPPLLVTGVSLTVLGEHLTAGQLAGVTVVSLALVALVFTGGRPRAGSGLGPAALTGIVIACYTLVDGVGVRESGEPLSYAMWLFALQAPLVLAIGRAQHGPGYGSALAGALPRGALGGTLALLAYVIVLWAQSQAPLALVSALRETSLLFAGLIGLVVFRERLSPMRLVATAAAVLGIVLLQAS